MQEQFRGSDLELLPSLFGGHARQNIILYTHTHTHTHTHGCPTCEGTPAQCASTCRATRHPMCLSLLFLQPAWGNQGACASHCSCYSLLGGTRVCVPLTAVNQHSTTWHVHGHHHGFMSASAAVRDHGFICSPPQPWKSPPRPRRLSTTSEACSWLCPRSFQTSPLSLFSA